MEATGQRQVQPIITAISAMPSAGEDARDGAKGTGFSFPPSGFRAGKRSTRIPRPRLPVELNSEIDDIINSPSLSPQASQFISHFERLALNLNLPPQGDRKGMMAEGGTLFTDDILEELSSLLSSEEEKGKEDIDTLIESIETSAVEVGGGPLEVSSITGEQGDHMPMPQSDDDKAADADSQSPTLHMEASRIQRRDLELERRLERSMEAAALVNSLMMKILASHGLKPDEKVLFELTKI